MMVGTSILAGSVLYLGYNAYTLLEGESRPSWWQGLVTQLHALRGRLPSVSRPPPVAVPKGSMGSTGKATASPPPATPNTAAGLTWTQAPAPAAKQRLLLATTALGVATISALYYPPLRVTALPVLVYLGVDPARRAQQALHQEGRVTVALAETAVIALCVVQGYYLVGSVGCILYYLGQVVADARRDAAPRSTFWQPPTWAWRQDPAGESVTAVNCLQVGDTIVIHTGEMIPVAGVVGSGTAWVINKEQRMADVLPASGASPVGTKVTTGDKVAAAAIVQVGCIQVVIAS